MRIFCCSTFKIYRTFILYWQSESKIDLNSKTSQSEFSNRPLQFFHLIYLGRQIFFRDNVFLCQFIVILPSNQHFPWSKPGFRWFPGRWCATRLTIRKSRGIPHPKRQYIWKSCSSLVPHAPFLTVLKYLELK